MVVVMILQIVLTRRHSSAFNDKTKLTDTVKCIFLFTKQLYCFLNEGQKNCVLS